METTLHMLQDGKTITHTGGSVEVFHSYQFRPPDMISSTSAVCQADMENKT